MGVERLAVREELGGPVDRASEAACCAVPEGACVVVVGGEEGGGVEFLSVGPGSFGFEKQELKAGILVSLSEKSTC